MVGQTWSIDIAETSLTRNVDQIQFCWLYIGEDDGCEFEFCFNGGIINISFDLCGIEEDSGGCLKPIRDFLAQAASPKNTIPDRERAIIGLFENILPEGRPHFRRVAPPHIPVEQLPVRTVQSHLPPVRFYFTYRTQHLYAKETTPIRPHASYAWKLRPETHCGIDERDLRRHSLSYFEVPVFATTALVPTIVLRADERRFSGTMRVQGEDVFCRILNAGGEDALSRELQTHRMIFSDPQTSRQGSLRVARLLGYVVHPFYSRVVGYVRQWVPGTVLRPELLPCATRESRQRWSSQLKEIQSHLRAKGVDPAVVSSGHLVITSSGDLWLAGPRGGCGEVPQLDSTFERREVQVADLLHALQLDD